MTLSARNPILDFKMLDHRITRSARTNSFGGIVRPICLVGYLIPSY